MPVVGVSRDKLFQRLGDEYTRFCALLTFQHLDDVQQSVIARPQQFLKSTCMCAAESEMDAAERKFDELCFQYGIELDDVVRCEAFKTHLISCACAPR